MQTYYIITSSLFSFIFRIIICHRHPETGMLNMSIKLNLFFIYLQTEVL